jgi:hypothetical protein
VESIEKNLKEEIESWRYLINVAETFGESDSALRLRGALDLAEYKLSTWRPRATSIHSDRRDSDIGG